MASVLTTEAGVSPETVRPRDCAALGVATLLWALAWTWVLSIEMAGISEPFGSVPRYLQEIGQGMWVAGVVAVPVVLVAAGLPLWGWLANNPPASLVRDVVKGVCLWLPFVLAWSIALMVALPMEPGFDVENRPEWMLWEGWPVLASPVWLLCPVAYFVWHGMRLRPERQA